MKKLFRRLSYLLNRDRIEADLREEIETHRLLRERDLTRDGAADAAQRSRRTLGNVTLAHEDARAVWIARWLQDLVQDVRFGLRSLRLQPVFTATAVITLAVGTAALAVVFSVTNTILLRPVPYANADRLVQITRTTTGAGGAVRILDEVASADVDQLRRDSTSFEAVTVAYGFPAAISGASLPEPAQGIQTDADMFRVLGTAPTLGRWPSGTDTTSDTPWVAISQALWRSQFQSSADVIGRVAKLNGQPHTIIAVMPDSFRFPAPYYPRADLWVPRASSHPSLREPDRPILLSFGVLRDGVAPTTANLEARVISSGTVAVTTWAEDIRTGSQSRLVLMVTAAAIVFLIVCVNLANMLLGRGVDRERELMARAALGAGRWRLVRQMLTETTLLFVGGGVTGCVVAVWALRGISGLTAYGLPRMDEVALAWPVIAVTFLVIWVAALVVGFLPALQFADQRTDAQRGASHGLRWRRTQRALMGIEVAMALVLLLSAGLLADVARTQARIDPGFNPAGLIQARVSLPFDRYPTPDAQIGFTTQVLEKLRHAPGVQAVAAVNTPPGSGSAARPSFVLAGAAPPASARDLQRAVVKVISDDYFATLNISPVAGTVFASAVAGSQPVAAVNTAFVRAHLPDESGVGTQLRMTLAGFDAIESVPRTIVGVVPDIREDVLYQPAPPTIYVPLTQASPLRMTYLVRTALPDDAGRAIRTAVASVDGDQALRGAVIPLSEAMHESMALNRLNLALLGLLSGVSVLLAVVGVYGVTAHNVRHRRREIGIRLALGVQPSAVRRLVLAEGLRVTSAGLLAGAAAGFWVVPALRSLVIGSSTLSPWTCAAAAAAVVITVVLACDIPARRAAALDPTTVLRGE